MKVGIIGARGYLGQHTQRALREAGHEIVGYSRSAQPIDSGNDVEWRIFNEEADLSGLDVLINFAGERIDKRWTPENKQKFHQSRIGVTQNLVHLLSKIPAEKRPKHLLNASAIGYYGDGGENILTDSEPQGEGYLAELCSQWEAAAWDAEKFGLRVVALRIGIVFGKGAPAWEKMKTPFLFGLGGRLGHGNQWMSWIHVEDLARAIVHIIDTPELIGGVNLVSPGPERNKALTKHLGKALKRPAICHAPTFILKLLLGEFSSALLASTRAFPEHLNRTGFHFQHRTIHQALAALTSKT